MSKNKQAMIIALIAGVFLLIEGISGYATWDTIKEFVTNYVADNQIIQIVFAVLIFIASLGGIAVIIGGLLIGKQKIHTGKLFILLGAGMGVIGLIVSFIIAFKQESLSLGSFLSIGVIGIILSIIARKITR